ncbi:MAG TPA: LCP family protein [Candidatus Saccharimonadales bacterium]|nr:LCP family protein [Candidatus Saccharimonadales bacterium]
MNDSRHSPRRVPSIDGFVVPQRRSRFDAYRPLHKVQQPHAYVNPERLRHGQAAAQPVPKPHANGPSATERLISNARPSVVAPPADPLRHAVDNSKSLADRYRPRDRSRVQAERQPLPTEAAGAPKTKRDKSKKQRHSLKYWLTHWTRRKVIKVTILTIVAVIVIIGGWLGWKLYRDAAKVTHNNNPFNLLSAFKPVPLKNQNGQVNILLAGDSADDPGHDGADLTDSIMIMTINTKTHQASMLSVPRDLWVNIPAIGHQKINAANTVTHFSQSGYPNGGMGQLEQVITENLGITIDYYALINYTAFRDAVNAVGGITVNIQSPDSRGLYDPNIAKADGGPLKLPNGAVTLNGQTALNLARARGDSYYSYGFPKSDFDRTQHQRQMLLAIKDKVTSASVLSNPLKVGQLADAIGNNVQTDMKINEIESFYSYAKDITDTNTISYNLNDLVKGKTLLANYTAPNGQESLIPAAGMDDFTDIQAAITRLFSSDPVAREGAQVVVLNGGNIVGLASKEEQALSSKNIAVTAIADAPKDYATTEIIDNSKGAMPNTKQALQKLFGNNVIASDPAVTGYTADFIVVLGQNQQAPGGSTGTKASASTTTVGD